MSTLIFTKFPSTYDDDDEGNVYDDDEITIIYTIFIMCTRLVF